MDFKIPFEIGKFYMVDMFFVAMYEKFSFLRDVIPHAKFSLKRTGLLPTSAADDTIVSKCVSQALDENAEFKGFCKLSKDKFIERLSERAITFGSETKRSFRKRAISLQLQQSPFNVPRGIFKKASQQLRRDLLIDQANLKPCGFEEAASVIKTGASSGFWWFTKKRKVLVDIFQAANFLSLSLNKLKSVLIYPSYVAYRVQQRLSGVKLRLIYVYPGVITLFEQMFLKPAIEYFQKNKNIQPYVVGSTGSDLVARWSNWQRRSRVVSIDWSSFDQKANVYLIKEAFSIIKQMFKMNSAQSFLFDLISFYFMFTPIYTTNPSDNSEGIVFKCRGVPSGSSFTNLVDTIVNLLAVYSYLIYKKYELDKDFIASLGDDIVIATNCPIDLTDMATVMQDWFDMEISSEKSEIFEKGQPVYFLGAKFDFNGRYIEPELALYQCSTTTSDLFVKCETSQDHFRRIRDKLASVCFKYSDGFRIYDILIFYVRKYLGVYDISDDFYTEIFSRATVPGELFMKTSKEKSTMRVSGWLIQ